MCLILASSILKTTDDVIYVSFDTLCRDNIYLLVTIRITQFHKKNSGQVLTRCRHNVLCQVASNIILHILY